MGWSGMPLVSIGKASPWQLADCPHGTVEPELADAAYDLYLEARHSGMHAPEHHWGWYGFIGELVLVDYLRAHAIPYQPADDYTTHDLEVNGQRIEIKTRRKRTRLYTDTEHNVNGFQWYQRPDHYVFVAVQEGTNGPDRFWLAGSCTPTELHTKGEWRDDPRGAHKPERFIPGWRIEQRHLTPIADTLNLWAAA